VYVATKIPPRNRIWPAPAGVHASETYPAEHIVRITEESLGRLGVETIDVQQFHV
jgi:aryl-alcohol dehydrogenase-like predicted oxidoreductase